MKRSGIATWVVLAVLVPGIATAQSEESIRSQYGGTAEMPDELAFRQFLGVLEAFDDDPQDRHMRLEIVAEATGLALHASGTDGNRAAVVRAERLLDFFNRTRQRMDRERLRAGKELVCDQVDTITADELFDSLNAIDDLGQTNAARHYRITRNRLRPDEQEALSAYLEGVKTRSSYTKLDNRAMFELQHQGRSKEQQDQAALEMLATYCQGIDIELAKPE